LRKHGGADRAGRGSEIEISELALSNFGRVDRRMDARIASPSRRSLMRYFMSIIPPADLKPEDVSQGLMDAMGPWMEKGLKEGTLISTGGLKPAAEGKRLMGASGVIAVTDGPFAEAKEVLGGYAV